MRDLDNYKDEARTACEVCHDRLTDRIYELEEENRKLEDKADDLDNLADRLGAELQDARDEVARLQKAGAEARDNTARA